jgi:hypothetical protein
MPYRRRVVFGPNPDELTGSLSERAIAGCWFEVRRLGGCGEGELRLRDVFPDRDAVQVGDWVACEYDVDDRWYLGRVVERIAKSPAGVTLRLAGMSSQLDYVFPGGFGSDADGMPPHRFGCTDLFPADPDRGWETIDCVHRPETLIQMLLEQYATYETEIVVDPELLEEATAAGEVVELKVRGTQTATSLIRDLALRARNASWGVDEFGRFYLLQRREAIAAQWQEGVDLVALHEFAADDLIFNRVLLTGGLVYADCPTPPCGVYRWQGNYLQPQSRSRYGERRIRLSIPWIRTPEDSQAFVREFFRVYAEPTPRYRIEVAAQTTLPRPWLAAVRVLDRAGKILAAAQPESIRVEFDRTVRFRIDLGPVDPRRVWSVPADHEIWPIAPSDTPGYGGGPVDVTSDGSSSASSTEDFTDCHGCAFMPRRWKLTLSGVEAGACADCGSLNGAWILERDSRYWGCVWTASLTACGGGEHLNSLNFYRRPNYTYLMVIVRSSYEGKYRPVGTFNCQGPNTFELYEANNYWCHHLPATVVLEPA